MGELNPLRSVHVRIFRCFLNIVRDLAARKGLKTHSLWYYIVNKNDQAPAEVEEQPFKHQHWSRTAENDQRLPSQETEDGSSDRCTQKALQHTLHPRHNKEEKPNWGSVTITFPVKKVCLSVFKSLFGRDKLSLRRLREIHHRSQTYFEVVWEETSTDLQGIISQSKLPNVTHLSNN